jgi:hypothetical protein
MDQAVPKPPAPAADAGKPPSLFLAAGDHGLRIVSENGTDWKNLQQGKEGEVYRGARFGNGRYVAVGTYGGSNIFASSRDGKTWETGIRDGKYVNFIRGLTFGNGTFLALGGDPGAVGDSRPFVMLSADGVKWAEPAFIAGKNILRCATFGNGRWVGVGDRGRRATSTDAKDWKDVPNTKAVDTLIDVAFGKNLFVGVGLHGLRMTTEDGLTWSNRAVGEEGEHLNSIVWAGDRFVAVGQGVTFFSSNGINWKREKNEDAPLTFAFGKGMFVGTAWKGRILHSTDALRWKQVHKCEHHAGVIAFGAGEPEKK